VVKYSVPLEGLMGIFTAYAREDVLRLEVWRKRIEEIYALVAGFHMNASWIESRQILPPEG
jgi:hypothetical protein